MYACSTPEAAPGAMATTEIVAPVKSTRFGESWVTKCADWDAPESGTVNTAHPVAPPGMPAGQAAVTVASGVASGAASGEASTVTPASSEEPLEELLELVVAGGLDVSLLLVVVVL